MTKYRKVDYCCMIGISYNMRAKCEEILEDIANIDSTFKYSIYNSKFPQYDQIIIVSSGTKDQAHKRGLLLCRRYFPEEYNLVYWVKPVRHIHTQVEKDEVGNS